jgi:RHS repeat-associated protein
VSSLGGNCHSASPESSECRPHAVSCLPGCGSSGVGARGSIASTDYVTDTVYNTNGTLKNRVYNPSGTAWTRAFAYTPGDRRISAIVMSSTSPTSPAQSDTLAWDSLGNLTSVIDTTTNQQTACYKYDQYQRLTRAVTVTGVTASLCATPPTGAGTGAVPWSYSYTLDTAGGLTQASDKQTGTDTTYTYPSTGTTPHLPSSITVGAGSAQTVTSDGAGRVKTMGTTTLTWDQFGMAATATSGGVTTTSAYTADGSRIARTDSTGSTTLFLPDQEITKTGSTLTYVRYIKHGGATVAVRTNDTTVAITANDIQNTPSISISAANAVTRRYATPYGAQIASTGGTLAGQRRFLDHVQDPTGFLDDAARTYSPSLGIFMAPDALAVAAPPSASNAYAYATANPSSYSDPTGLWTPKDDGTKWPDKTSASGSSKDTATSHGEHSGGQVDDIAGNGPAGADGSGIDPRDPFGVTNCSSLPFGCATGERGDYTAQTVAVFVGLSVTAAVVCVFGGCEAVAGAAAVYAGYLATSSAYTWLLTSVGGMGTINGLKFVGNTFNDNALPEGNAIGGVVRFAAADAVQYGSKTAARQGLPGLVGVAANRFFRGATAKSEGFQSQLLDSGGYRLQFFSPARNPGYGKLYVQEINAFGDVVLEYKNTLGPQGLIETKWIFGGQNG